MFVSAAAPAILALASAVLALPSSPMVLFEAKDAAPEGWSKLGAAAKDEVLDLRIQLKKQNVAKFQELALNVGRFCIEYWDNRTLTVVC